MLSSTMKLHKALLLSFLLCSCRASVIPENDASNQNHTTSSPLAVATTHTSLHTTTAKSSKVTKPANLPEQSLNGTIATEELSQKRINSKSVNNTKLTSSKNASEDNTARNVSSKEENQDNWLDYLLVPKHLLVQKYLNNKTLLSLVPTNTSVQNKRQAEDEDLPLTRVVEARSTGNASSEEQRESPAVFADRKSISNKNLDENGDGAVTPFIKPFSGSSHENKNETQVVSERISRDATESAEKQLEEGEETENIQKSKVQHVRKMLAKRPADYSSSEVDLLLESIKEYIQNIKSKVENERHVLKNVTKHANLKRSLPYFITDEEDLLEERILSDVEARPSERRTFQNIFESAKEYWHDIISKIENEAGVLKNKTTDVISGNLPLERIIGELETKPSERGELQTILESTKEYIRDIISRIENGEHALKIVTEDASPKRSLLYSTTDEKDLPEERILREVEAKPSERRAFQDIFDLVNKYLEDINSKIETEVEVLKNKTTNVIFDKKDEDFPSERIIGEEATKPNERGTFQTILESIKEVLQNIKSKIENGEHVLKNVTENASLKRSLLYAITDEEDLPEQQIISELGAKPSERRGLQDILKLVKEYLHDIKSKIENEIEVLKNKTIDVIFGKKAEQDLPSKIENKAEVLKNETTDVIFDKKDEDLLSERIIGKAKPSERRAIQTVLEPIKKLKNGEHVLKNVTENASSKRSLLYSKTDEDLPSERIIGKVGAKGVLTSIIESIKKSKIEDEVELLKNKTETTNLERSILNTETDDKEFSLEQSSSENPNRVKKEAVEGFEKYFDNNKTEPENEESEEIIKTQKQTEGRSLLHVRDSSNEEELRLKKNISEKQTKTRKGIPKDEPAVIQEISETGSYLSNFGGTTETPNEVAELIGRLLDVCSQGYPEAQNRSERSYLSGLSPSEGKNETLKKILDVLKCCAKAQGKTEMQVGEIDERIVETANLKIDQNELVLGPAERCVRNLKVNKNLTSTERTSRVTNQAKKRKANPNGPTTETLLKHNLKRKSGSSVTQAANIKRTEKSTPSTKLTESASARTSSSKHHKTRSNRLSAKTSSSTNAEIEKEMQQTSVSPRVLKDVNISDTEKDVAKKIKKFLIDLLERVSHSDITSKTKFFLESIFILTVTSISGFITLIGVKTSDIFVSITGSILQILPQFIITPSACQLKYLYSKILTKILNVVTNADYEHIVENVFKFFKSLYDPVVNEKVPTDVVK